MPYNRALLAKLDKQNSAAAQFAHLKAASEKRKPQVYERRLAEDDTFLGYVTLKGFVKMMGPRATRGVYRNYKLVPCDG